MPGWWWSLVGNGLEEIGHLGLSRWDDALREGCLAALTCELCA